MNADFDILKARQQSHQRITDAAMDAHAWVKLQGAIARSEIRRLAEFPARSAGQIKRYQRAKSR